MNDVNIENLIFRTMSDGDAASVFSLVENCFDEFVKPDLTPEGVDEFFRAAREIWSTEYALFPCFWKLTDPDYLLADCRLLIRNYR